MKQKEIFNEFGDDSVENRKVLGGDSTGIMNLNSIRYKWTTKLSKIMLNNFWIPEKVSLVEDKVTIKGLTPDEMYAFKCTLSFLIALDSMQVSNLPKISDYITAPEVSAIFTIQGFQELIHSQSYQYILNELFPYNEREEIYNYWRTNPRLLERNKKIAAKYQQFIENQNEQTFKIALAADFALEGIYFYCGFNFFHQLASRNKAVGVDAMINYIENDEVTHVSFFNYLINDIFNLEDENDVNLLRDTLREAALEEIEWNLDVYGDKILGISKQSSEEYVKWLANQRCKVLKIPVVFEGFAKNPYAYLDADKRGNFFEASAIVDYSQSTAVDGWDDF